MASIWQFMLIYDMFESAFALAKNGFEQLKVLTGQQNVFFGEELF